MRFNITQPIFGAVFLTSIILAACSGGGGSGAASTIVPRFAYVVNNGTSDISAYAIEATTGALTQIPCGGGTACNADNFLAGTGPTSASVDPSGKFAYVANAGSNDVSAYTVDGTGALTPIACDSGCSIFISANFAAGANPSSVTVDPSGRFAYVTNVGSSDISAYKIDPGTGALTSVGAPVVLISSPVSVSVDPSGRFAYVTYGSGVLAYKIDFGTGALTSIGTAAAGTGPLSVAVDPSGKFVYVANNGTGDVSVFQIDTSTGALTSIGTVAAGTSPLSVAVDPSGKFVYVANNGAGSGDVSAYRIDATTGALTPIPCRDALPICNVDNFLAGGGPTSISVEPFGKFVYVTNSTSNDVSAYTIDANTGALTPIPCGNALPVCNVDNFLAGGAPYSVTTTGKIQ